MSTQRIYIHCIELSRVETFTNGILAFCESCEILSAGTHSRAKPTFAIRESFLREILYFRQFAKLFTRESFQLLGIYYIDNLLL